MLSNNVPTAFSVEESNFLHVSGQSGLNFMAHQMHSLMEDRVISVNDLCIACTKKIKDKMFINKI